MGATGSGAVERPDAPSRQLLWVMTGLYLVTLPITILVAMGALVATVMGLSATLDGVGGQGVVLTVVGVVIMAVPVVLSIGIIAIWVAEHRGSLRLARRLALVPLPFLALSLSATLYIWAV